MTKGNDAPWTAKDSTSAPVQVFDIRQFSQLFPLDNFVGIGNDFMICDISYDKAFEKLSHPCKFDGFLAVFCLDGELDMDLNLTTYHIRRNSFMVSIPAQIIRIDHAYEDSHKFHCFLVAVSREFLSSIAFDFSHLFSEGIKLLDNPVVTLSDGEIELLGSFIRMAYKVMESDIIQKQAVIGPLVSSVYNVIADIWTKNVNSKTPALASSSSLRSKVLLEQFLRLLADNYREHRNLDFYAGRLGVTAKYLSKVVKAMTGKSAAQWIDSYVVLEAKNLLKHSDMNIKEIVVKMNFISQSVFYKFFKTHTGMTPTQYRNS